MKKINIIEVNKLITNELNDNNFKEIYKINLDTKKNYFITLSSSNSNEFNLRLFDNNKEIIKLKYDTNEILNYENWEQTSNDLNITNNNENVLENNIINSINSSNISNSDIVNSLNESNSLNSSSESDNKIISDDNDIQSVSSESDNKIISDDNDIQSVSSESDNKITINDDNSLISSNDMSISTNSSDNKVMSDDDGYISNSSSSFEENTPENNIIITENNEDNVNDIVIQNEFTEIINNILTQYINEMSNDIEIVIEFDNDNNNKENTKITEDDITEIIERLQNKPNNFNNKLYLKPKYTGEYYLLVSSDFKNKNGEYNLLVQEVENINNNVIHEINLNEDICFTSRVKFETKEYKIKLKKDTSYIIKSNQNVKYLISFKKQQIISNSNEYNFKTYYNGSYNIEIIPFEQKVDISFNIVEI